MTSQLDIYRAAQVLLKQYGDEAFSIAMKRERAGRPRHRGRGDVARRHARDQGADINYPGRPDALTHADHEQHGR
jgi:hypothetical protein